MAGDLVGGAAERPSGGIRRLFRLWRLYAYMDLVWVARDFRAAVMYCLSDLVLHFAAVTGTFLLAERFDGIGPWSKLEVVFMLGYTLLATGILDVLFNYNVKMISRRLGRGQLDHTLIQPQPLWVALLTEGFTPFSGSMVLLPGLAVMAWALSHLAPAVSPLWLAALVVNLVASAAIVLAFNYLWGSLAFWAPRGAEEINTASIRLLDGLKPFPLDGLGPAPLVGLLTVVPSGFVGWYPSRALLGIDQSSYALALTPLAALAFLAAAVGLFCKGLRHYERTGSQRYLSFGHRR